MDSIDDTDPAAFVAAIEARARRVETPCGDGTLVWRMWGAGAPIVLVHGSQGAWSHWIRSIAVLARHRTVIALDLPGHGDSAMPEATDHAGIARPIADGLRRIGGGRPIDICGFSLGGVALAWLAADYPDLVRRLILVGCGGLGTARGPVEIGHVGGLRGAAREAALRANLLGLMLHHPDSVDALALYLLVANARQTRWTQVKGFVMPDRLAQVLPRVGARVDAIWGAFDRPHPDPADQAAAIRRTHPECDFRVVADAGHWAMYERPAAFNATLLDMLGVGEDRE